MAMTITQEQFEAAYEKYKAGCQNTDQDDFAVSLATLGITITPAEPPAEMVKLAREIVAKSNDDQGYGSIAASQRAGERDDDDEIRAALAALQHVVDVAAEAESKCPDCVWGPWMANYMRNALGARGRDAG